MYRWQTIVFSIYIAVFIFVGIFGYRRYKWRTEQERRAALHDWSRWRWSQDGWVRKCKLCSAIQYGGDSYEEGPDASGNVEA
jgi:hypothetical protein